MEAGLAALVAAGPGLAWVAFNYSVSGHVLPATFYVKAHAAAPDVLRGVAVVANAGLRGPWSLLGLLGFALGLAACVGRAPYALTSALAGPVWFAAIVMSRAMPDSEAYYLRRYLEPGLPFLFVTIAVGCWIAWERGGVWRAAAAMGVIVALVRWPYVWAAQVERYEGNCRNIDEVQVAAARWVAANVAPTSMVAAHDAGAMRFFGDSPVLDLVGLNSHQVAHGDPRAVFDAVRPDVLVGFPMLVEGLAAEAGLTSVAEFSSDPYTICPCPGQERMVVFSR